MQPLLQNLGFVVVRICCQSFREDLRGPQTAVVQRFGFRAPDEFFCHFGAMMRVCVRRISRVSFSQLLVFLI